MLLSSHDQAGRLRLPDRSAVRLSEMDDIVIKTFPEGFESVLLSQSRLILFRIRRMVKIKLEFVCDSAKGILAELDTLRNQWASSIRCWFCQTSYHLWVSISQIRQIIVLIGENLPDFD